MTLFENLPFIDGNVACGDRESISSWRRHQMETFSALLVVCAGNSPVPGEFPPQRPVTRSFDVFFDLRLNKRLLSGPLWRQCNVLSNFARAPSLNFCSGGREAACEKEPTSLKLAIHLVRILLAVYYFLNVYLPAIYGMKRKPHWSVAWMWYHVIAIAILHLRPTPTVPADTSARLQLPILPTHGGLLLLSCVAKLVFERPLTLQENPVEVSVTATTCFVE